MTQPLLFLSTALCSLNVTKPARLIISFVLSKMMTWSWVSCKGFDLGHMPTGRGLALWLFVTQFCWYVCFPARRPPASHPLHPSDGKWWHHCWTMSVGPAGRWPFLTAAGDTSVQDGDTPLHASTLTCTSVCGSWRSKNRVTESVN